MKSHSSSHTVMRSHSLKFNNFSLFLRAWNYRFPSDMTCQK
uniref:Uncharacterized protein n=1 Tax=Anguilla anguilla TaxID=7936 RepID=A0A0E9QJ70_ANGAN